MWLFNAVNSQNLIQLSLFTTEYKRIANNIVYEITGKKLFKANHPSGDINLEHRNWKRF